MSQIARLKKVLIGKPIASKHAHHERLPKLFGLPVFASDALSSVAYASEEILLVLVFAGAAAVPFLFPTSLWLAVLMVIVGFSYYQTIHAYPKGGGTYRVSTENLGSLAGRVAAASLLIDYILTVSVSVSSGVSAIISAYSRAEPFAIEIGCLAILCIMVANLRGARESGIVFAIPTYSFVVLMLALIATALFRSRGMAPVQVTAANLPNPLHGLTAIVFLRAFAASCTALTGTEAIADGVQAFRPPEAKNAAQTLMMMVALLLVMFLGLSWGAQYFGILPKGMGAEGTIHMTVLAKLAALHWGNGTFLFWALQIATALILFLAANTAFADFPRLCSFVARDGFLPRQLLSLGDRLVFQNGILVLSGAAIALIISFRADTHKLMPMYAIGVFISFTLSQSGMVARAFRIRRGPDSRELGRVWHDWRMYINLLGALTTLVVSGILAVTKFKEGAWLIVVAEAVFLTIFYMIRRHYNYLAQELTVSEDDRAPNIHSTVLLLVPRLHKGILLAIAYSKSITKDCRAVHVSLDPTSTGKIKEEWNRFGADIPLVILDSPFRSLTQPVIEYIDQTLEEDPKMMITVIVPQAVPRHWYHSLLHNNAAMPLKLALAGKRNVVITNVRYFLN